MLVMFPMQLFYLYNYIRLIKHHTIQKALKISFQVIYVMVSASASAGIRCRTNKWYKRSVRDKVCISYGMLFNIAV